MKKRTIILILAAVAMLAMLDSCKRCVTCTQTTTTTCNGNVVPEAGSVTTIEACGSDIREIDGMEVTQSNIVAGKTYVSTCRTECD